MAPRSALRSSHLARLAVLLLIAGVAVHTRAGAADDGQPLREAKVDSTRFQRTATPAWVAPMALSTEKQTVPFVTRLADTQLRIGERKERYVRRAVSVTEPQLLKEIGQISIEFVPDYQTLQLHGIRVHRGTRTIDRTTTSVRFLQRETEFEQGVYSGAVTAAFVVEDVRVGDTVEWSYTVVGDNPVFTGRVSDKTGFDDTSPILHRRMIVSAPTGRPLQFRFIGPPNGLQPQPAVTEAEGWRRTVFEQKNLPAVRVEDETPSGFWPFTLLHVSEYATWSEVAAWAAPLFDANAPVTGEAAAVVGKAKSLAPPLRVSAALQFVQNEIRYFSVSLGESSHRPALPAQVVERRFGDCKDKTLLLLVMLRELGVPAEAVLVSLDNRRGPSRMLPAPHVFDHVIVRLRLNDRWLYVDPTFLGQTSPPAAIGQLHVGAFVLPAVKGATELIEVPMIGKPADFAMTVTEVATVDDLDKPARVELTTELAGVDAEILRLRLSGTSRNDMRSWLTGMMERRYPGARMLGDLEVKDDIASNRVRLIERYEVPQLLRKVRDSYVVRYSPDLGNVLPPQPPADRVAPVGFPQLPGHVARYAFELRLPPVVNGILDPAQDRLSNAYFEAERTRRFRGNVARNEWVLSTKVEQVMPADFSALRTELEKLNGWRTAIIVDGAFIAGAIDPSLSPAARFERHTRDRFNKELQELDAALKDGKVAREDLPLVQGERAGLLAVLERFDEAMSAVNEGLRRDARNPDLLLGRALLHLRRDDPESAIADLNRGLPRAGESTPNFYKRRGQAMMYAGRPADAARDFAQAASIDKDGEAALFARLWQLSALARANQPIPAELQESVKRDAGGAWPRPLLALFTGARTPEQVLAAVATKTGDERLMAECEAHFYIGQWHLYRGDRAAARASFQRAIDTRVLLYVEFELAPLELKRLASQ